MNRIEQEKQTVRQMVGIYCRAKHGHRNVEECAECKVLLDYAYARLDRCPFGERKSTCKQCPVHCYQPAIREQMRQAMRYAGPRMLWHHPIAAIRHLWRERR